MSEPVTGGLSEFCLDEASTLWFNCSACRMHALAIGGRNAS